MAVRDRAEVEELVLQVIRRVLMLPSIAELTTETALSSVVMAENDELVMLALALETEFNLPDETLDDADQETFKTVASLVDKVAATLGV